jgi:hypothetical protein
MLTDKGFAPMTLRRWLIELLGGRVIDCEHKWTVLIENYPTFTQDYWTCKKCGLTKAYPNDAPPEKLKIAICDLGDVHIINGRI